MKHKYAIRQINLPDGPAYVDFDFVPRTPSYAKILELCPHTCALCDGKYEDLRPNGCQFGNPEQTGATCPYWDLGHDDECEAAYQEAENTYWLTLHSNTMKGQDMRYLRALHGYTHLRFLECRTDK